MSSAFLKVIPLAMTEEVPVLGWLADPITSRPVLQYLKQFDRRIWIFQAGQVTSITMQHEVLNEVGLLYYFQYLGTLSGGLRFFFHTRHRDNHTHDFQAHILTFRHF